MAAVIACENDQYNCMKESKDFTSSGTFIWKGREIWNLGIQKALPG